MALLYYFLLGDSTVILMILAMNLISILFTSFACVSKLQTEMLAEVCAVIAVSETSLLFTSKIADGMIDITVNESKANYYLRVCIYSYVHLWFVAELHNGIYEIHSGG